MGPKFQPKMFHSQTESLKLYLKQNRRIAVLFVMPTSETRYWLTLLCARSYVGGVIQRQQGNLCHLIPPGLLTSRDKMSAKTLLLLLIAGICCSVFVVARWDLKRTHESTLRGECLSNHKQLRLDPTRVWLDARHFPCRSLQPTADWISSCFGLAFSCKCFAKKGIIN